MLRECTDQEQVEFLVLDFADASKHLIAARPERRYMAGKARRRGKDAVFVYNAILYGHIAGPLVWARLAAAVFRATAAMQRYYCTFALTSAKLKITRF